MGKKSGERSFVFESRPSVLSYASVVGKKESDGPLAHLFDKCFEDDILGEKTFEQAESHLQKAALFTALDKANIGSNALDFCFAGDLLNQCVGSTFGLMEYGVPFVGMYGACSTMALTLINACVYLDSGIAEKTASVTSSHFCTAERQYRFPLEYGSQRPQTAQWTVTGSGCVILSKNANGPYIHSACIGSIENMGVTDSNNMGAAMAPAAYSTIKSYFDDTNTSPSDYDAIFTGDLGAVGSELLCDLFLRDGIDIKSKHEDCGLLIYDREKQDVHSGGSGCGCSASVLSSYILGKMQSGELNNILFVATGALLSKITVSQGLDIPSVAHLVNFRNFQ